MDTETPTKSIETTPFKPGSLGWGVSEEEAMIFEKKEMIEKLRNELEILDKGGYEPSTYKPYRMPRVFRDSVSCPNVGLDFKIEPCTHCFLMEFVPLAGC